MAEMTGSPRCDRVSHVFLYIFINIISKMIGYSLRLTENVIPKNKWIHSFCDNRIIYAVVFPLTYLMLLSIYIKFVWPTDKNAIYLICESNVN